MQTDYILNHSIVVYISFWHFQRYLYITGGIIVTAMREEYLESYDGKLELYLHELENCGYIERLDRRIVNRFFYDKTGLILSHRVLISGFKDFSSRILT